MSLSLDWTTPARNSRVEPPKDTVAIVVDVRSNKGAIEIGDKDSNKHIEHIGTEELGHTVVLLWKPSWFYGSRGTTRVAHVRLKRL